MASCDKLFATMYERHDRRLGLMAECLRLMEKMTTPPSPEMKEEDSTVTTTEETLDDVPDKQLHPVAVPCAQIHLSIDNTDKVDPDLNLVKVCGGCPLREKMNKAAGNSFVVIVDRYKPIPVEVVPFTAEHTLTLIGKVFNELPSPGNYVVVEHGMFTRKAPWPPLSSASLSTKELVQAVHTKCWTRGCIIDMHVPACLCSPATISSVSDATYTVGFTSSCSANFRDIWTLFPTTCTCDKSMSLEIWHDSFVVRPIPRPFFNMASGCCWTVEWLWFWKPPWPYLHGESIRGLDIWCIVGGILSGHNTGIEIAKLGTVTINCRVVTLRAQLRRMCRFNTQGDALALPCAVVTRWHKATTGLRELNLDKNMCLGVTDMELVKVIVGCSRLEKLSPKWCCEISNIVIDLLAKKCPELCLFFAKLVDYTFLYWLPFYLSQTAIGGEYMSAASAGYLSVMFDVGGIFGGILADFISDQFHARATTAAIFMFLAIPSLVLFHAYGSVSKAANIGLMMISGLFVNGPYALITTAVSTDLGTQKSLKGDSRALATVTAIIDGTGSLGDALGPFITGFISKKGWDSVFIMLALCVAVAAVLLSIQVKREIPQIIQNRRNRPTSMRRGNADSAGQPFLVEKGN